jgi:hypothetical protein
MSDDARGAGVRGMINEMVNTFPRSWPNRARGHPVTFQWTVLEQLFTIHHRSTVLVGTLSSSPRRDESA